MSDVAERWAQTAELFTNRMTGIGADAWDTQSTCSEWTVRQLVEHAVETQARFAALLGVSAAASDWSGVHTAMTAFLNSGTSLEATVEVPGLGAMSTAQILEICTNDLLIHTWDVARSIGTDESLPEPLVAACYSWLKALPEQVLRSGRYSAVVPNAPDADLQAQMLAFAGREP